MITACDVCKPCINKTGLNCVAKEVIKPISPTVLFSLTVDVFADVFPLVIAVFIIPRSKVIAYHLTTILIIIPVIRLA